MNLTSHDDNGTMQVEATLIPDYIAFTSLFLCSIVLAVGLLGNLMVIIVILTSKALRSSTNMFLLNLSVADMLVLATCTPSTLVEIATRKTDAWYMGKVMCYLTPFVELSVSHTSILTILAITCERYYAICLPLQANLVCTKSKACITCLVVWICAFGLTAPILTMIEYQTAVGSDPSCFTQVDSHWQKFYHTFIIIVFFFIPLLILVLLYMKIARNLVPSTEGGPDDQVVAESSNVLRSRKQVVSMLTTVVVFFFACMMPFKIFILWIITLDDEVFNVISMETYYLLLYFCRVMFYINSAINPILYNIMSSRFREGFRKVFHCVEWPLTPQRFRLATSTYPPGSTGGMTSGSSRRKTTLSTASGSLPANTQHSAVPPPPSAVSIEGCQKAHSIPADWTAKSEEEKPEQEVGSDEEFSSSFGNPQSFCKHHEKNIVFIEERKILVIPTSSSSSTNNTATSSTKTTDI